MLAGKRNKFVFCAAFKIGFEVTEFLIKKGHRIEFIVTSDKDDSEFEKKIWKLCAQNKIECLRKRDVNSKEIIKMFSEKKIDLVFLAWWPTIIIKEAIESVKIGWLNMHPSLLPFNRGKHPYYWSIIEGTPFGVTIHFIDKFIDSGRIAFQKEIFVDVTDTGESLYKKSLKEIMNLFKDNVNNIFNINIPTIQQDWKKATFHLAKELDSHSMIRLEENYKAKDLINILRGRSFTNGDSAFFYLNNHKYLIKVKIEKSKNK